MTIDTDFQERYRRALAAHVDGSGRMEIELDALELGKLAINGGQGLLDLLSLHQTLMPSFLGRMGDWTDFGRLSKADAFLTEAVAPFEMIFRGWRDMIDRLRDANDALERKVVDRTAALSESEQRFRDIAAVSGDLLWETDSEHCFIFVAGDDVTLMGRDPEQIRGATFASLFGVDPGLAMRRAFRDFRCSVTGSGGQKLHLSISGGPVFDAGGTFHGYRGTVSNQTAAVEAQDRAQAAEAMLRAAHGRLDAAFNASPAAIIALDRQGRVTLWNPAAHRIYGRTAEEMIGKPFDLVPDAEREHAIAQFRQAFDDEPFSDGEGVHLTADGRQIQVTLAAAPLTDGHGGRAGALFVIDDVTDKRQIEHQLRQSQKMEAMGQLTGGVAHDFNNILMVILANVEALEEEQGLSGPMRELLAEISGATQRATDLTRQLLTFSRKQPLRPRRTDVNALVTVTGKLLRRTLGEHVEIDAILADDLWPIDVDRALLESALVNLCVNARDAMPGGGKLLIETRNVTLDVHYAAQEPEVVPGDYVLLSVTDTGAGIPPEVLERVFEPFFSTKEVGKGTGLGLSMVYGFTKQSNGHIKIYSEPGHGTAVKMYLPRAGGRTGMDPAAETADQAVPRGHERIVVTEDDAAVRTSVAKHLRSLGYTVTEASDGEAGLAALTAAEQPYDLLLTDVVMPGRLNGKALADEAARRWPAMRIVFMSGYSEDAIIHHGRLDPGVRLLAKPFRKVDLARALREALEASQDPA
jgi:PAS domain S-box-containing protein